MSPNDPMLECEYKVVVDDPAHPGETVVLYYKKPGNVPAKWKAKTKKLKVKGKKEPKPK